MYSLCWLQDLVNGYFCECRPGYDGIDCERNVNDCASSPCVNGMCNVSSSNQAQVIHIWSCIKVSKSYFSWFRVHNVITFYKILINFVLIQDLVASYSCTCPPGWTGVNCAVNINDCSPNPCRNRGLCIVSILLMCSVTQFIYEKHYPLITIEEC